MHWREVLNHSVERIYRVLELEVGVGWGKFQLQHQSIKLVQNQDNWQSLAHCFLSQTLRVESEAFHTVDHEEARVGQTHSHSHFV